MNTKKKTLTESERWELEKELYQTAKPYHDAYAVFCHAWSDWVDKCKSMGISKKLIEEMAGDVHRQAGKDAIHGEVSYTEEPFGD